MEKKTNTNISLNGKEKVDLDIMNQPKMWNESEVKLLKKWAELSASYRVLHDRAHRIFKYRNYCLTIPVIIFSTILGTASFSQSTFPKAYQPYIPMGIGSLNIISGIITTIAQFTRVGELSEANRVASIAYGKFSRNIATELSLPPEFRTYNGIDFVQICRSEFDRLLEQSPIIPINILKKFMKELDDDIERPDIMKVSKIEEWKPTKEEKAAKIIASAFQTMHNKAQEKTGVQKMAEMVQKKGFEQVNRLSSLVEDNRPSSFNQSINEDLKGVSVKDIQDKVSTDIEKGIEEKKKQFTGFIGKQVESRAQEIKNMSGTGLVSGLISKKNTEIQEKTPTPIKHMKSNVFNIIQKAKQNIQTTKDNYDEITNEIHEKTHDIEQGLQSIENNDEEKDN